MNQEKPVWKRRDECDRFERIVREGTREKGTLWFSIWKPQEQTKGWTALYRFQRTR